MANFYTRASQAEMLGIPYILVSDQCLRTDLNAVFVCASLPSNILANWIITASGSGSTPVPQQGVLADLPARLPVGTFYFATDVQILYVGTVDGNAPTTALPLSGPAADVPTDAPAGFLYFATDTSVLYVALGQGSTLVVPPIHSGTLAEIGSLVPGAFYLTSDTNQLFIGAVGGGNVLIGPPTLNILSGTAVCTGSGPTVNFTSNFKATLAPSVIVAQIGTSTNGLGVAVHVNGTNGAWTGFTLELSGSFFGAYAWVAVGNPN